MELLSVICYVHSKQAKVLRIFRERATGCLAPELPIYITPRPFHLFVSAEVAYSAFAAIQYFRGKQLRRYRVSKIASNVVLRD